MNISVAAAMQEMKHGHSRTKARVGSSSEHHVNMRFPTMQYHVYMIITIQYHVNMILQLGPNLHQVARARKRPPNQQHQGLFGGCFGSGGPHPKKAPKPAKSSLFGCVLCSGGPSPKKAPKPTQSGPVRGVLCAWVVRARKRPPKPTKSGPVWGVFCGTRVFPAT